MDNAFAPSASRIRSLSSPSEKLRSTVLTRGPTEPSGRRTRVLSTADQVPSACFARCGPAVVSAVKVPSGLAKSNPSSERSATTSTGSPVARACELA
jgi:hypothetical protein